MRSDKSLALRESDYLRGLGLNGQDKVKLDAMKMYTQKGRF